MAHLTQLAQSKKVRNTKENSNFKSRSWVFTLNNYMQSEIVNIQEGAGYEYVFQEETGKEGTPHLQGGLYFKNAVSFNSIKKMLPRAHIEKCRNWHATKSYCSKGESRTGKIYTNIKDFEDKWHSGTLEKKKVWTWSKEWAQTQIEKDIEASLNDNVDFGLSFYESWGRG